MLRHGNIFCKGTHFFRSKSQVAPFFFSPMAGGGGQIIQQAAAICHDTVETTDFMVSRSRMGKDWQKNFRWANSWIFTLHEPLRHRQGQLKGQKMRGYFVFFRTNASWMKKKMYICSCHHLIYR